MKKGNKVPDSDKSARKPTDDVESEASAMSGGLADRQTSNKSGKHSSAEKLAASRPEFGGKAKPVPGADGDSGSDKPRNPTSMNR